MTLKKKSFTYAIKDPAPRCEGNWGLADACRRAHTSHISKLLGQVSGFSRKWSDPKYHNLTVLENNEWCENNSQCP